MKIFVFLLLFVGIINAHPHIFIEYSLDFEFDENKQLRGFWVDMEFDEMFSISIIEGADANGDKVFNKTETKKVFIDFFSNLKSYNYYLNVNENGKVNQNLTIKNFSVSVEEDLVTYKYFVPLSKVSSGTIVVSMYDEEYFCSIENRGKTAFKVLGDNSFIKSIKIVENEEESFYFDQIIPEECHLEF